MSKADELWADQLLERVRGAMVPTRADAARNFAGIEAGLGLASSGAPPMETAGGTAGPGLGVGPNVAQGGGSSPLIAARGLRLSAQLGVLVSFGLATGVVGFLLGRSSAEPHPSASPMALVQPAAPLAMQQAPAPETSGKASAAVAGPAAMASPAATAAVEPRSAPLAPLGEGATPRHQLERPAPRAVLHPPISPSHAQGQVLELSEALDMLRRAEAAVRRSDGLEARMWLGDLDRRAPREMLREERLATQALAACALGDMPAARAASAELEQVNPESMYRARLEGSCATPGPAP